jgi:hypothetical protein
MSVYWAKVKTAAIAAMQDELTGWSAQDCAEAADEVLGRGFGYPGTGFTGRVVANALRKVRPISSFQEAVTVAGNLNQATYTLTGSDRFDKEPFRCTHCGERFSSSVSPKTHHTVHTTVFDPRTF